MTPRDRGKHKSRREIGNYSGVPHAVQDCPNWAACSGTAIKMLCDLTRQYNGRNNGDLCAALSVLKRYGWTHSGTVTFALRELRHFGFIMLTRQGGRHAPSLYALTWYAIDDCKGKLDCAATTVPPGDWKQPCEPFKRPPRKNGATQSAVHRYALRSTHPKKAA